MSEVSEALKPLSDYYCAMARDVGASLRVDASYHGRSASGPMVYGCSDPDFEARDHRDEEKPDTHQIITIVPESTVVEWVVDSDGTGELHWFTNPSVDVVSGRIGTHKVGSRSRAVPMPVPLSDRVADNDLAEIERLLRERGHTKGFTEKQIAAAEKKRGVGFPPELRLLFSLVKEGEILGSPSGRGAYAEVRDGLLGGTGKLGNVVDPKKRWGRKDALPTMPAPTAKDVVQPAYASPLWIVFADDGGGNAYALDLVPGPKGALGQVVQFDHELDTPPLLVAESLTEFLRGRLKRSKPWGPAADAGSRLVHSDSDRVPKERRLTPGAALTATEVVVNPTPEPFDHGMLRGSRALVTLEFDKYGRNHPEYDLSALPTLTALQDLSAPEAVWAQIIEQDAFPPRLAAATITESRDLSLERALEITNAVLEHYGKPTFTLQKEPIG
ncbi:hypothetical protein GCM10027418_16580 [Mariniluteicoccus endophyticus]